MNNTSRNSATKYASKGTPMAQPDHPKTEGDIQLEGIPRLQQIQEEMKRETTALQKNLEKKFKLKPGQLNRILDDVLKYLDQEEAAAISKKPPPMLSVDVAGKIEKEVTLEKGSVNKIIASLLKVKPEVTKWDIRGRLTTWWKEGL